MSGFKLPKPASALFMLLLFQSAAQAEKLAKSLNPGNIMQVKHEDLIHGFKHMEHFLQHKKLKMQAIGAFCGLLSPANHRRGYTAS